MSRTILHPIHLAAPFAAALLFHSPAHAVQTYCIGTPAEFQTALDSAEVDGEDSKINVMAGAYDLTSNLVYDAVLGGVVTAGKLTIDGGYGQGCASHTNDATLTTLHSDGNGYLIVVSAWGNVTIKSLSFVATGIHLESGYGAECAINDPVIELRRVHINGGDVFIITSCYDVVLRDSLLNAVGGFPDTLLLANLIPDEDIAQKPSLTVINSSVIGGAAVVRSIGDELGIASLYNSIFDSPGSEILAESVNVYARYNRYDNLALWDADVHDELPPGILLPGSGNNVNNAPDLDANYRPNPGSSMVNSGTSAVPYGLSSIDLFGDDRVVGASVDRGATERQSPPPPADVYNVVNTATSGAGSLAAAIDLANADAGFDTIEFDIPGACPRRINVPTTLSIRDGVLIDGWSQPGSEINDEDLLWVGKPCVSRDGNGTTGTGLITGPQLGNERMTVRGLAFEGFSSAILMTFGNENTIAGNQFGGQIGDSGPILTGNDNAITIAGSASDAIVGGFDAPPANLIGDSGDAGIVITGNSDGHQVLGNRIGVDKNPFLPLSNEDGLRISTSDNLVLNNTIAHNRSDGISLSGADAKDNQVYVNFIHQNARMGVMIDNDAHDNTISGGNVIANNGDSGVRVMSAAGGRNAIHTNSIYGNGAPGIDLGANDVTPNDSDPLACPPIGCAGNGGQNFPVIEAAYRVASPESVYVVIPARLTTVPSDSPYRIDFYRSNDCDDSGHGQGRYWIGSQNATVVQEGACFNGNCPVDINFIQLDAGIEIGDAVSATATGPGGSTSEFAACVLVEEGTLGDDTIFADGFDGD